MLSQRERGVFQCVNMAIILLGSGYLNPHIYKLATASLSQGFFQLKNYNFNFHIQHRNWERGGSFPSSDCCYKMSWYPGNFTFCDILFPTKNISKNCTCPKLLSRNNYSIPQTESFMPDHLGIEVVCVCVCACVCALLLQACPILWNSKDCSPPGFSVRQDSLGKNVGVGCHSLLQGIFLTQGLKPCVLCLLHWQVDSLPPVPPG